MIAVRELHEKKRETCEPILRSLPLWFGIESAIVAYLDEICGERMRTWTAHIDARATGFVTVNKHNPYTAEVHVMAVLPDVHRQGVGRALLLTIENWLLTDGCEYLLVKTLGESHPDPNYARTRSFYQAMGFRPVEELKSIWGEANPCLLMIKRL